MSFNNFPPIITRFDVDDARLAQAVQGNPDCWVLDAGTEQLIQTSWSKHATQFFLRGTEGGHPIVPRFAREYPALQAELPLGTVLVTPWRSPAGVAGGWVASMTRHKTDARVPIPLALATNTDTTYGARVVFPTAQLALMTAMLHSNDGRDKGEIKVMDQLYWAPGPATPQVTL